MLNEIKKSFMNKKMLFFLCFLFFVFLMIKNNDLSLEKSKEELDKIKMIKGNSNYIEKINNTKNKIINSTVLYLKSIQDKEDKIKKNDAVNANPVMSFVIDENDYPEPPEDIIKDLKKQEIEVSKNYKEIQEESLTLVLCIPRNLENCISPIRLNKCATYREMCKNRDKFIPLSTEQTYKTIGVRNTEKYKVHQDSLNNIGTAQGNVQYNKE
jgi:hypothetical protein